jgi:hypothetical protein
MLVARQSSHVEATTDSLLLEGLRDHIGDRRNDELRVGERVDEDSECRLRNPTVGAPIQPIGQRIQFQAVAITRRLPYRSPRSGVVYAASIVRDPGTDNPQPAPN